MNKDITLADYIERKADPGECMTFKQWFKRFGMAVVARNRHFNGDFHYYEWEKMLEEVWKAAKES